MDIYKKHGFLKIITISRDILTNISTICTNALTINEYSQ